MKLLIIPDTRQVSQRITLRGRVGIGFPFFSISQVDCMWMEICVAVGALCSMTGGVINCAFCLARAIYVMGRDGLLPAFFAKTSEFSHTPVNATMFGAVLSVLISIFVDFVALIEFLSLVAFMEFVIVAMACVVLRYCPPRMKCPKEDDDDDDDDGNEENSQKMATTELSRENDRGFEASYDESDEKAPLLASPPIPPKTRQQERTIPQSNNAIKRWADRNPTTVVFCCLLSAILNTFVVCIILTYKIDEITGGNGFAICVLVVAILLALVSCAPLWILRQYSDGIPFKVMKLGVPFKVINHGHGEGHVWLNLNFWQNVPL